MDENFNRLERAILSLKESFDQRFDTVDQRFDAVDRRFDAVDQRFDELRAQLKTEIESVRDDVRMFAEAHVALEQRVTKLERRPR